MGNNPVKYVDPDGRKTKNGKVQSSVDNLGNQNNLPVSEELVGYFKMHSYEYVGNDIERVQQANNEIKQLAQDDFTMVDSWTSQRTVSETKEEVKNSEEQYKTEVEIAAAKMIGAKPSIVSERKSSSINTSTKSKTYDIQIYVASNIDPDTNREGPIFKTFLDVNKDGNIDFVVWGHVGGYNEN